MKIFAKVKKRFMLNFLIIVMLMIATTYFILGLQNSFC